MNFTVDKYTINIHKANNSTSKEVEIKRLTSYVETVCKLGQRLEQTKIIES